MTHLVREGATLVDDEAQQGDVHALVDELLICTQRWAESSLKRGWAGCLTHVCSAIVVSLCTQESWSPGPLLCDLQELVSHCCE